MKRKKNQNLEDVKSINMPKKKEIKVSYDIKDESLTEVFIIEDLDTDDKFVLNSVKDILKEIHGATPKNVKIIS